MDLFQIPPQVSQALRIDRALKFAWEASPGYTIVSGLVLLACGGLPALSLYLMKLIIDTVTEMAYGTAPPAGPSVFVYIGLAFGLALLTVCLNCLADYLKKAQTMAVAHHMDLVIHEKSIQVDLEFYESPSLQDTLHRVQKEGPFRPSSIVNGLYAAGQNAAAVAGIFWLLASVSLFLPLIMGLGLIPGVLAKLRHTRRLFDWQKSQTQTERKAFYYSHLLTGRLHAKEIRLFDLGQYFLNTYMHLKARLKQGALAIEKKRNLGDLAGQAARTILVFGIFAYLVNAAIHKQMTIGTMVMVFQGFQRGAGQLKSLLTNVAQMYEDNLFLSHLYEFLAVRPAIASPKQPEPVPETGTLNISFENVTFFYHNQGKKVLDCVNFSIKSGEIVAVVGENGSGKSSIVKLLCRLYDPHSGRILLNGEDTQHFDPVELRSRFSLMFQDLNQFQLSAKENILLGDITKKEDHLSMTEAAACSGIHQKIVQLDSGYDTILGTWFSGSRELSTGQWQMLAAARAFYRSSDLIVLDEPSSALDPANERHLMSSLRTEFKNRAVLIVSHRLSTIKDADKIIVLSAGRIIEQGSHDQLMKNKNLYAQLFTTQAQKRMEKQV